MDRNVEVSQDVIGLLSPIQLESKKQTIPLEDYFMDVYRIDSLAVPRFLKYNLSTVKRYF